MSNEQNYSPATPAKLFLLDKKPLEVIRAKCFLCDNMLMPSDEVGLGGVVRNGSEVIWSRKRCWISIQCKTLFCCETHPLHFDELFPLNFHPILKVLVVLPNFAREGSDRIG